MADIDSPLPSPRAGGPCDWPFDLHCCQGIDLAALDQDLVDTCRVWVAEMLWMATGRRFGLCERTIRPCNRRCMQLPLPMPTVMGDTGWPHPYLASGEWFNSCGCNSATDCSCGPLCQLCLPGPVYDICEVTIDGLTVDPATYRVDDHRYLVKLDAECWPQCQHMDAPIDAPGSFAVRYRRGVPVPEGGAYAAGVFLCEVIKQCTGDKSCRLPRNLTQINRAGVQANFTPSGAGGKYGANTGIPEVDMWVALVNPSGSTSPNTVWSPDTCKSRTTTAPRPWTVGSCTGTP